LLSLTLLVLVFSGPAAVAAYLLSGDASQAPVMLAATGEGASAPAATPGSPPPRASATPVLTGVLYTRGTAEVDWNGVKIPVEDGSYAYLGGEMVSTGSGDMGVLQLDADNRVYMCPGSRMSLARGTDGAYHIEISRGGGRFAFAPGTDYRIEANRGVLSPGPGGASQPTVVEVTVFEDHPGGVVCGFSSRMNVAGYPAAGGAGPIALGTAGPGEVIDLSRALRDEAAGSGAPIVMQPIPMPESVQSWLRSNVPYPSAPGPIGYLCRCEELKRYAEADGIPDVAIAPRMSPPDSRALTALPASDVAPPVVPPKLPAVVVAAPEAPNPADSGVMPEPASSGPILTVPPPLVPVGGSGGGVTSTPS
jgi:hypothetical protein